MPHQPIHPAPSNPVALRTDPALRARELPPSCGRS